MVVEDFQRNIKLRRTRPCLVLTSFFSAIDFSTDIFFPEEETKDFGRFPMGRDLFPRSP
jgi:hypothetical protein